MGDKMQVENWVPLKDVQKYLGVGRETILQWISKRNMPAYKVGRLWKFKLSEVDDWIRSGGASDDNAPEKEELRLLSFLKESRQRKFKAPRSCAQNIF